MMPRVKWQTMKGSNILKMEEIQWIMSSLANLQLQNQTSDCPGENIIYGNCQFTIIKVAEEVGISIGSCHTILMEDLGMHHVSAKFVQRLDWRSETATIFHLWKSPNVIIGDETCVYSYDAKTKQSSTLEEPCFTLPQESMIGALTSERNAACFFQS